MASLWCYGNRVTTTQQEDAPTAMREMKSRQKSAREDARGCIISPSWGRRSSWTPTDNVGQTH